MFLVFLWLISWRLWCYNLATVTSWGDGASEFLGAPSSVTLSPKPCLDSDRAATASGATFRQFPSGTRFSFKKPFSSEYEFTVNLPLIDSHKSFHFVCVVTEMESSKCHRLNYVMNLSPQRTEPTRMLCESFSCFSLQIVTSVFHTFFKGICWQRRACI